MLAVVIAVDSVSAPNLKLLCTEIIKSAVGAYIILVEHCGENQYSNGALLNVGVKLAGLPSAFNILFFSFLFDKWIMSEKITVEEFTKAIGYDYNEYRADILNPWSKSRSGISDIFASTFGDRKYGERFYHYLVKIEKDRVLNVNYLSNIHININVN
jgi:hypothetical protein